MINWHPPVRLRLYRWVLDQTTAICHAIIISKGDVKEKVIQYRIPDELVSAISDISERFYRYNSQDNKIIKYENLANIINGIDKIVTTVMKYRTFIEAMLRE